MNGKMTGDDTDAIIRKSDLQHIELQLSGKDIIFLFTGFATTLTFIGTGFVVFNNEVCKPAMQLGREEIRSINQKLETIEGFIKNENLLRDKR